MRELFTMWKNTRMVVLASLTAAIYAAVTIPLKGIPIIPGITEIRPAACIPVVFGIFFGPAACWGVAIGNLIADFFGTLGIGSLFGFFGNFLFALVAYKLQPYLVELGKDNKPLKSIIKFVKFILLAFLASSACAITVAWGLDICGLYPFKLIAAVISINNTISAAVLGPVVFLILYPRVKRWSLLWTDILPDEARPMRLLSIVGFLLIIFGITFGLTLGLVLPQGASAMLVLPCLIFLVIGCVLI